MKPTFFANADGFRRWLLANHATASELVVGFHKVGSGLPSITWRQAVDQALCFGWIDGVRHGLDQTSYTNRFTPRRRGSNWSAINIKRVGELREAGLMHPAGIAAFEARDASKSAVYPNEGPPAAFDEAAEATFRANATAWDWFGAQAPSYRRSATHWVMSGKRADTRARRLARLIDDSAAGRLVGPFARPARS